ncbi:Uma2 family endonuclease [Lewinella cohaerens]|uniref:Uma2 family endonuclease n=1 Tax=Lewinella cohaerens TaxID=70995 RepID=UPI00037EDB2D|nr:Uma2 family endonuclease [Lewinella cohaerens]
MAKKINEYTIQEYLEIEENALEKSEFFNGRIVGMSSGTIDHGIIGSNANIALGNAIDKKKLACIPINSEVRVYVDASNSFVYPDGMIVCGEVEISEVDPHAVTNPILIVEVLSKSTERYDRGDKFHKYCSLPSFQEYVLIDSKKPVVDILYREDQSSWKMVTTIGLDKEIYIHTLDTHISMETIYRNTLQLGPAEFGRD